MLALVAFASAWAAARSGRPSSAEAMRAFTLSARGATGTAAALESTS